jgi:cysteinyl-tRNA synthetase
VDYSEEAVISAQKGWERLMGAVSLTRHQLRSAPENGLDTDFQAALDEARTRFLEAMDDDFNSPKALGLLQNLTRDVNALLNGDKPVARATLKAIDKLYSDLGGEVLGLVPDETSSEGQASAERQDELIHLLIDLRAAARQNKDFATSDRIRDELADIGVMLEDRPDGTSYKIQ